MACRCLSMQQRSFVRFPPPIKSPPNCTAFRPWEKIRRRWGPTALSFYCDASPTRRMRCSNQMLALSKTPPIIADHPVSFRLAARRLTHSTIRAILRTLASITRREGWGHPDQFLSEYLIATHKNAAAGTRPAAALRAITTRRAIPDAVWSTTKSYMA